jgi:transposase
MRKIKEVLRLKYECGLGVREIARSCQVPRTTVSDYLRRAREAGISWSEASELTDTEIEEKLFPVQEPVSVKRPEPDYECIYNELRTYRKFNLTLTQLWLEYKDKYPDGYQYSQFCELYRQWKKKLDYYMRQEHRYGEKVFIDYCDGLSIIDLVTGEPVLTQLFVAVWGASNHTYAEATLSQTLPEWIGSHRRALDYFGCVPRVLVPDNLRSGVNKACKYEPELNPTYADMAEHYGCAVIPTRPRKPRDKGKVESGVLIAQRWILAVLRKRTFYSLVELNAAISECLEKLNTRPMRRMKVSRRELFESLDRPNALPLPARPYEYAEWIKARVEFNYHIRVDDHNYSVPYQLVHEKLDVRLTVTTVEAFRKGQRVAVHLRSNVKGQYTTLKEHMPPEHRAYAEWTPSRFIKWAAKTGTATAELVEKVLAGRSYPEQAYKTCMGIINLGRYYDRDRVEAAAQRALKYNACNFRSMKAILTAGLDKQPDEQATGRGNLPLHENIRGKEYYR